MRAFELVFFWVCVIALICAFWQTVLRHAWHGGWRKYRVHSCGYFDPFAIVHPPGDPCKRCGKIDGEWQWKIARPAPGPIGWEWQEENSTSTVHK